MNFTQAKFGKTLGQIAYWCAWPGLFLVLNNSERTRAIVACGDEILVVRGWLSDGKWGLPGGGLHRGEAIRRGCLRELREEADMTLRHEQLMFVGKTSSTVHGIKSLMHVYAAELKKKPPVSRQRFEIAELAWVDWHTLHPGNASGDTLDALRAWLA
jgi:ADP-ribose pyrophosphatase YjhB (NUDIX family)